MIKKRKALSSAFKRAKGIKEKLRALKAQNLDLSDPDVRKQLALKWAEEKATMLGGTYIQYLPGQEWYIAFLFECSTLTDEELLQKQYEQVLPDYLSEEEMIAMLSNI